MLDYHDFIRLLTITISLVNEKLNYFEEKEKIICSIRDFSPLLKKDYLDLVLKNFSSALLVELKKEVEELKEQFINNKINELKENVNSTKYSSEYINDDLYESMSIEIFKKYFCENMEYQNGEDIKFLDEIQKVMISLCIPLRINYKKFYKKSFTIDLMCSHSGNTNNLKCKGRDCKYKIHLNGNYRKNIKTFEFNEINTHSHDNTMEIYLTMNKLYTSLESNLIKEEMSKYSQLEEFQYIHSSCKISPVKLRKMFVKAKGNIQKEIEFLGKDFEEDQHYLRITNKCKDGSIHSMVIINKDMIKKSYSYDYWIIDDSVNVNVYNKPLFVCMVRDEYGTSQILFFGYLFDKKEESFNVIFDNVKEYLPALPKIIISDRDNAQFNSVKSKFPSSLVIFCLVHIFRNLNKFFCKNHLVIRLFRYVQMGWIPEEFFLKCIDIIVNNNIENDEEGTNEEENNWYEILNEEDGDILSSNELKKLLEESKSCKINKGIKCIKLLIEQKEHWIRSVYIKNGIYHEKTSNRAESFFGNLKVSIKHKKLLLFKLTEIIIGMANGKRNVVKYTELNDRILKKEYHENITYMAKEIMNKQIMLLIEGKYKDNSSTCRSCLIRNECPALSWPCVHLMKDKIGNGEYIFTYDELPLITKKKKRLFY